MNMLNFFIFSPQNLKSFVYKNNLKFREKNIILVFFFVQTNVFFCVNRNVFTFLIKGIYLPVKKKMSKKKTCLK